MKKIYASVLSLIAASACAYAQPTLTSAAINPVVGDMLTIATSAYVSPGSAGANQTWNPGFTNTGTSSMTGVTPGSTPYAASFPSATVAFNSGGNWVYYKSSSSAWQNDGVVNGSGVVLSYSNPEDFLHFPFNYNNTYVDPWNCTFVQSTYTYYRTGTTTVTADGWGTLTTPAGTFSNVMRVHFVQNYQDSTNIASTPFVITYLNDEYEWYLNGNHYPIAATYSLTAASSTSQGALYLTNAVSGIDAPNAVSSLNISPNPANDIVKLDLGMNNASNVSIHVFDMTGKEVLDPIEMETMKGENTLQLSVADLPEGMYFASVMLNGETTSTQRIVVTH